MYKTAATFFFYFFLFSRWTKKMEVFIGQLRRKKCFFNILVRLSKYLNVKTTYVDNWLKLKRNKTVPSIFVVVFLLVLRHSVFELLLDKKKINCHGE